MRKKSKRNRKSYSAEFKTQAIELAKEMGVKEATPGPPPRMGLKLRYFPLKS